MYISIQSLYAPIPSSPHSVKKIILCHAGEDNGISLGTRLDVFMIAVCPVLCLSHISVPAPTSALLLFLLMLCLQQ